MLVPWSVKYNNRSIPFLSHVEKDSRAIGVIYDVFISLTDIRARKFKFYQRQDEQFSFSTHTYTPGGRCEM